MSLMKQFAVAIIMGAVVFSVQPLMAEDGDIHVDPITNTPITVDPIENTPITVDPIENTPIKVDPIEVNPE